MNVIQKSRKRAIAQQNRDYLAFNRINPIGVDQGVQHLSDNNLNNPNEVSITTFATRGNSVEKLSSTYISITSGRGYAHGEVGIAYIDIESPAVKLIQLSDDPWYSGLLMKIHIIDPCQIILPHTIYEAKPETSDGKLVKFIRDEFPKLCITKVPRRHFSESDGMDLIKKYCSDKYNYVKEEVNSKYYALSAASGLLKYLQFIHNIYFKENGLKLEFEMKFAHMQIDIDTSYKLELLPQSNPNSVKSNFPSLFDVLDHCVTSLGKRTLRARILEPMCDIPSITSIHDCIAELNQPEFTELSPILRNVLHNFNNVERLHKLALIVPQDDNIRAAEILINQALHLKKCLQLVPTLRSKLAPLTSPKLQEITVNLLDQRYESILNHIDTVINRNLMEFHRDSSSQLFQRIHCVQTGVNDLIDNLRNIYNDLVKHIETLVGELSTKHRQPFKMNYSFKRGFHLVLMIANRAITCDIPDELEVLDIKRNTCFLTSPEVNKLNIRIQNVIEEITVQSNVVIAVMLNQIVKEIDVIYDLSGFIATLDIILSFALTSANENYVCPSFGDEMRITDAVHPLLEQNIHRTVAIPNNVIATPEYNFFIITGPNMSGKTVYIKTIATLQIMAQLGCYVPAKSAQFRITDRIFSRIGFNDSIERNMSTFIMEMNNMEHILKNVTPNSLVIIDELCRSTNPKEGAQLAWNLCSHLATIRGIYNDGKYFEHEEVTENSSDGDTNTMNDGIASIAERTSSRKSNWKNTKLSVITAPFIYLTTHFRSLTMLPQYFFNVVNLSFSAEQATNSQQTLLYDHRIREGVTTSTSYGLAVARTVRFPAAILNLANELSRGFTSGEESQNTMANRTKQKLSYLSRKLMHLSRSAQISQLNDAGSVISAIINTPIDRRRRNRLANNLGSLSTSSSVCDLYSRVDRIMYNGYGDIMSIARTTKMEFEMQYQNAENDDNTLLDTQNERIEIFLAEFCRDQPNNLIEAIGNVDISSEMATSPGMLTNVSHTNSSNNSNPENPEIDVDEPIENPTEKSSIISIQDFRVAHGSVDEVNNSPTDRREPSTSLNCKKTSLLSVCPSNLPGSIRLTVRSQNRSKFSIENTDVIAQNSIENLNFNNSILGFNLDSKHTASNDSLIESFQPLDEEFNDFFPPATITENDNFSSSKYFSQQVEDDTRFNEVTEDFDKPSSNSFQMDTFSMGTSSQSQKQRPNIGNIRRAVAASRSISQDFSSWHSDVEPFTSGDSVFCSSDSVRSSDQGDGSQTKKKIPIIRKSKLDRSVFGDTSTIFKTHIDSNMNKNVRENPTLLPPVTRLRERDTDSNYSVAMLRLQRIDAAGIRYTKTTTQPKISEQNQSKPQETNQHQQNTTESTESGDFSRISVPPPPGYD